MTVNTNYPFGAPGAATYGEQAAYKPPEPQATSVDARVRQYGPWKHICEFVGTEFSPDKTRKCKFYDKSSQRNCCMWFRDDLNVAGCDCREE
jgi:hypothetical protein